MMFDARIPAALGASLLLHAAALALVERMPRGWQVTSPGWGQWSAGALQARLRAAADDEAILPASRATIGRRSASPDLALRHAQASSSGIAAPPRYLPAEELDERPLIRTQVQPAFPPDAPVASGRVVLRLLINEAGAVDQALAVQSDPPGVFDEAAVEAFASARFTPGRKDGNAVRSSLRIELQFGEGPAMNAQTRRQDVPLWQPPRRARIQHNTQAQEKP
jgi:TonB family protein